MGRRESGNMARNASTRSLANTPGSSMSKLESIASTAVRAADKVGVRMSGPLCADPMKKTLQEVHLTKAVLALHELQNPAQARAGHARFLQAWL